MPHWSKATLLAAWAAALPLSCRTPGDAALKSDAAAIDPAKAGLDVNDVSILIPLPEKAADIGRMIPLSLSTAAGKPLVSEGLFQDILRHFKYGATIDGTVVPLDSGTAFESPAENGKPGPFNSYADWKIVALRYDPCAPSPQHNLRGKGPGAHPGAFDAERCGPQIRLTAQPVLPDNRLSHGRMHFAMQPPAEACLYG